jgi:hypothetical protein
MKSRAGQSAGGGGGLTGLCARFMASLYALNDNAGRLQATRRVHCPR